MSANEEGGIPTESESTVDLLVEIQKMRSELKEDIEKNQKDTADKLQSIEASISKLLESNVKKIDKSKVPATLKNVFEDIANFEEDDDNYSEWEEHHNVKWRMRVARRYNHLVFSVHCEPHAPADNWSIRTKLEWKVVGRKQKNVIKSGRYCYEKSYGTGFYDFVDWEALKKWYLVDGNLTVEAKVTILETTGLGIKKIREFDESQKEASDVILVVMDTKFYVLKMYLAAQSTVFKALLFGNFKESDQLEVKLNGIHPDDFHRFLEVLYGEPAIDEFNVEDIARLADMYDAPTAIRQCEEFYLEKSKKPVHMKLEIATRYNLEKLKEKCMSDIQKITSKDSKVSKKNPLRKLIGL
ncbi:hypothetical protein B9Z55_007674 [Caenorhabditis nigoni]|uniref:BTB domain-containing protein n=1 Tax=Caenorhabditis nigoni TaxID=1611254 RepID=A0A2G5VAS0_9PELO|nr:hypothetical protein B9Z55_007674 [Caenorhabditis nigoni]